MVQGWTPPANVTALIEADRLLRREADDAYLDQPGDTSVG